jgi:hypothetical protein
MPMVISDGFGIGPILLIPLPTRILMLAKNCGLPTHLFRTAFHPLISIFDGFIVFLTGAYLN